MKTVSEKEAGHELNEIDDKSPGDEPAEVLEAIREHLAERAAIMEMEGGLPRLEAERQAQAACRVFEYRLRDNPVQWSAMIMPGCGLHEARRHCLSTFGDRLLEVREFR